MESHQTIPKIYYKREEINVSVYRNDTILATSLRNKIHHNHVCGGNARCSSCRVVISEGLENCLPRNEKEAAVAETLQLAEYVRLACQTRIVGDIEISKPPFDDIDIHLASMAISEGPEYQRGVEKDLSIMFVDIEDFTPMVETSHAYDILDFLNKFFYIMGNIAESNGARIIDYYGDGFLSVFGMDKPESMAQDCVRAGIEMFEKIRVTQEETRKFSYHDFRIRIGVRTGKVIVGTVGTANLRKLSVMGDAVNTASRIEGLNKELKTHFLICNRTYKYVKDEFDLQGPHEVIIKGKRGKHKVWEVKTYLK